MLGQRLQVRISAAWHGVEVGYPADGSLQGAVHEGLRTAPESDLGCLH